MVDYEIGSVAWDIGQILTRHGNGTRGVVCLRVKKLRDYAFSSTPATERLKMALATQCTCGVGNSDAETTSLRKGQINYGAGIAAVDADRNEKSPQE